MHLLEKLISLDKLETARITHLEQKIRAFFGCPPFIFEPLSATKQKTMSILKKVLNYLLYSVLFLFVLLVTLMIFPKGDLETQLKNNNVPALGYAIIEDGKITELRVVGELEKGKIATENTIFNVASVTKPVFATMIMNLVDDGLIDLDEPVYPYWIDPEIEIDKRHKLLTPRILLSHKSGFPNWRWLNEDGKLAFINTPGTKYGYSGEGMEYLKKAVENKLGKSLIQLMDSIIFTPAKMIESRLIWDESLHAERLAKFHDRELNLYKVHKRTNPVASDDLCSTTLDMANFVKYISKHRGGLSANSFEDMVSINTSINERSGYGLGWQIVSNLSNNDYALVHGGSDQGVRARIVILPNSKSGFVAFTNGDNGQKIIDRLMVSRLDEGDKILSKIYAPFIWRVIHLPFELPF